jgi:hypothetical protein
MAAVNKQINPAQLMASASITGADKTYDGLLAATASSISGSTSGALNGDAVALDLSGISLAFDNAHAGARRISASGNAALGAVTGGGAGLKDGTAGNAVAGLVGDYSLPLQPVIAAVNKQINPAQLMASASITGADKTYDGLLAATGSTISAAPAVRSTAMPWRWT